MKRMQWHGLGMILAGLAACDPAGSAQDAGAGADGAVSARAMVSAAQGGRVRSADGLFELVVAPGAVAQDTVLSVRRLEGAAIPANVAARGPLSGVYAVEPDGLQFRGDGAYAVYRFPTTPDGLVTGSGAARAYEPLVAVAQPAAGGAIDPHPECTTLYDAPSGRVQFVTRVAHLSTQFVARVSGSAALRVGVDFGEREHLLGVPFETPMQITAAFPPNFAFDRDPLRVFNYVPPSLTILTRNTGNSQPLLSDGLEGQLAPRELTVTSWLVPVGTSPFIADPPPDFVCRTEGSGVGVGVGAVLKLLQNPGRPNEKPLSLNVVLWNPYDCVDRPPPQRDAGRDAPPDEPPTPADAAMDVGGDAPPDVTPTGLDAAVDVGGDAAPDDGTARPPDASDVSAPSEVGTPSDVDAEDGAPCPTTFTRCGRDCADLSSDLDHCGACGVACALPPPGYRRACRDYRCEVECPSGTGDCDGNVANGCETRLNTRLNCGRCGAMPVEVCDGVDNDCDGAADEGCPTQIVWPNALPHMGPVVGRPVAGDARSTVSASYFNPILGLCGTTNADGTPRQLRGVYGYTHFRTDRTVTPFRYWIEVEEVYPGGVRCEAGIGGGSTGGAPWALRCPPGMIADGISGLADAQVGQVQLRCARWDVVRLADGVWRTTRGAMATTTLGGSGAGTPFSWSVPDDVTTQNPGALRYIAFSYSTVAASVIRTLQPYGVSPVVQ